MATYLRFMQLWTITDKTGYSKTAVKLLGKCRTLWGEREQAMRYSNDCYVAKALLPVRYAAKTRFVTQSPLSTKVSWLQRSAFQSMGMG